jgi:aryl-phospho-beta-D-glucosidase BglC (GH1 family)
MGINVVRVPVSPQTLTGTDPQGMAPYLKNTASVVIPDSLTALKTVVQALDAQGIYVLLDIHSCSNYVDWRKGRLDARPPYVDATRDNYDFKREDSSCSATNNPSTVTRIQAYDTSKWLANLKQLAGFESTWGVSNIIGIDIFNEPWDYTWAEWSSLISQAYTAINGVNPNILIFAEGISDTAENQDGTPTTITAVPTGAAPSPNWGGNLYEAGGAPPAGVPKSMLVFSPHVYGISVFVGKQFVDNSVAACVGLSGDAAGDAKCPLIMPATSVLTPGWDAQWGYLKAQGYAVVIGEFGGNFSWPGGAASLRDQNRYSYVTDHTIDQKWQQAFVAYLHSKCINDTIYWSINPESGDTGGLYTTPYNATSNTGGWGTWGGTDSAKLSMLSTLWNTAPGTTCGTGPTVTPITPGVTPATPTRTPTPVTPVGNTPTRTRTPTTGPSPTRTRTPTVGTPIVATNTPITPVVATKTNTPVTPTTPPGGACTPVTSVVTAPYTLDGVATSCLQIATIPGYINSWNATTVSINGTVITNLYVAAGSLPAKISGNYYIKFVSTVAWGHIEIK